MYKLKHYQEEVVKEGIEKLTQHGMLYLMLSMRLGKTTSSLHIAKEFGSILFVTTKSAIKDVLSTPANFGLDIDLTVINYESLHKLEKKVYDTVIIDECQKISAFPKKNLARKRLDNIQFKYIIWMSGTPKVESNSQMFNQLNLAQNHKFNKYRGVFAFQKWYKDGYGIMVGNNYPQKYIFGGRTANDYSQTHDFSKDYEYFTIKLDKEEAGFRHHTAKVNLVGVDMPDDLHALYTDMKTKSIAQIAGYTFISNSGASRLSKLQQLANGVCISEEEDRVKISEFKAKFARDRYKGQNVAIFYKYIAEKDLYEHYGFTQVYQIDSGLTGVDLSHLDKIVIGSLTFSGTNYLQALDRMMHQERSSPCEVDILISNETIELDIYEAVSSKKNFNTKTYKE